MKRFTDEAVKVSQNTSPRAVVPFTGGILFVAYAFFWPEQYGHWLGTIVRAFRSTAGF